MQLQTGGTNFWSQVVTGNLSSSQGVRARKCHAVSVTVTHFGLLSRTHFVTHTPHIVFLTLKKSRLYFMHPPPLQNLRALRVYAGECGVERVLKEVDRPYHM